VGPPAGAGPEAAARAREAVDAAWRDESRRVLATLIRLLGDFDLAEEALSDAFAAALETWPHEGVPQNPRAWLVSSGRFRAIDALRRRARFDASVARLAERAQAQAPDDADSPDVADDRLRLIFTCCKNRYRRLQRGFIGDLTSAARLPEDPDLSSPAGDRAQIVFLFR
jgi:predicted RNA polymerase sigma factor